MSIPFHLCYNVHNMLKNVQKSIAQVTSELFNSETVPQVSTPEEQFGDVSSNIAMQLTKELGRSPREIAEQITEKLRENVDFTDVSVAGPGFINVRVSDSILLESLQNNPVSLLDQKKILVEYSDPNPMKPLHAGHLYTTLVGDVIARLVERAGADTIRINYGGDVGLHVGKAMWGIVQKLGGEFPEKLGDISENERAAWLGARYIEGNSAYEDDEVARAEIIALNKRAYVLHDQNDHESPFAQIYWICRQWSYDYFTELYKQLQVHPFDRFIPESEVTPLGLATVAEQLERGVFERSEGAVVFNGEKFGLHTRVFINSEGLPTYEAKDVGLSLTKWREYQFDQSIIITATEQQQYMQVVIKAVEQFEPEPARRTTHLTHGVVKLSGGVKMSSRKGNVVTAMQILEAAREAGAKSGSARDDSTVLAAVKYAFMKNRIGGDIHYDPMESVALEGNSGPYLQYAYARAKSIVRKSEQGAEAPEELLGEERTLVRKLSEFNVAIDKATEELAPHHICTFLYELAQVFNRFYENNKVIGDKRERYRLYLINQYASTLKEGLGLLGIQAPEQM